MSERVRSRETPVSHPHLFQRVAFRDVRRGDIFQGKKDRKKWYRNDDVSQKESKYTYWRRKPAKAKRIKPIKVAKVKPPKAAKPNKALLAAERRLESAVNAYYADVRKHTALHAILAKKYVAMKSAFEAVKKARKSK